MCVGLEVWISITSGSSASILFRGISLVVSQRNITSWSLLFSSLSMYWSWKRCADPMTASLPYTNYTCVCGVCICVVYSGVIKHQNIPLFDKRHRLVYSVGMMYYLRKELLWLVSAQ